MIRLQAARALLIAASRICATDARCLLPDNIPLRGDILKPENHLLAQQTETQPSAAIRNGPVPPEDPGAEWTRGSAREEMLDSSSTATLHATSPPSAVCMVVAEASSAGSPITVGSADNPRQPVRHPDRVLAGRRCAPSDQYAAGSAGC